MFIFGNVEMVLVEIVKDIVLIDEIGDCYVALLLAMTGWRDLFLHFGDFFILLNFQHYFASA